MVPFFGLGRCRDKCRPEQKPEARSGFQTNKIESVDAVVCCRVGAGSSTHSTGKGRQTHGLSPADSPRHWLLWEATLSLSGLLGVMVCLVLGGTGHYQGHVFTYKRQMGKVSCHQTASPASAPSRAGRPSSCLAFAETESDMWLACQKEAISQVLLFVVSPCERWKCRWLVGELLCVLDAVVLGTELALILAKEVTLLGCVLATPPP